MVRPVTDSDNSKKLTGAEGEPGERGAFTASEDKLARRQPVEADLDEQEARVPGDRQRGVLRCHPSQRAVRAEPTVRSR